MNIEDDDDNLTLQYSHNQLIQKDTFGETKPSSVSHNSVSPAQILASNAVNHASNHVNNLVNPINTNHSVNPNHSASHSAN